MDKLTLLAQQYYLKPMYLSGCSLFATDAPDACWLTPQMFVISKYYRILLVIGIS